MYDLTEDRVPPSACQHGMCVELSELWTVLTPTTRRNVLQTLSRIIAQQLPKPATGQEVLHESRYRSA